MNNYYEIFRMYSFLENDDHTKINFALLHWENRRRMAIMANDCHEVFRYRYLNNKITKLILRIFRGTILLDRFFFYYKSLCRSRSLVCYNFRLQFQDYSYSGNFRRQAMVIWKYYIDITIAKSSFLVTQYLLFCHSILKK